VNWSQGNADVIYKLILRHGRLGPSGIISVPVFLKNQTDESGSASTFLVW